MFPQYGGAGNWHIYQDGGISCMEYHRVQGPSQHRIRVLAKNSLGEVTAETVLTIEPQQDYRPDLRHVEPGQCCC